MNKLRLLQMGKKYWKQLIIAVVAMVLASAMDAIYPLITKSIIDDVIGDGKTELLGKLLIAILVVCVVKGMLSYIKEFTFDCVGCRVGSDVRKKLFGHIQGLSMDYFERTNTGEIMARVKEDSDRMWDVFGMVGMLILEVTVYVGMILYFMFRLNAKLAMVPLAIMIILGILAYKMEKSLDKTYTKISEKNAELTTVAEENLSGVRTVKAFAQEDFEIAKFKVKNDDYYEANMAMTRIDVKYYPWFQFVGTLLPVSMIILGGVLVIQDQLTLGGLVAFVEYSRNCVWPMEVLGEIANEVSAIVASYKKINKVFAEEPSVKELECPTQLEQVKGKVSFDHVDLTRGGHNILQDISFTIEPGHTLGIMGETGSGKSSMINLIERFYDADKGAVYLDDVNVKELSFDQLRSSVSAVMQDVFLFSDSVTENIRMGDRETLLDEDVIRASIMAKADSFIDSMEDGYDTIIGERGVGLSGGQKQRISIARSVAKKSQVLILDDSTSALDLETEHEIQYELDQIKGKTRIIVAHRISAVRHADEIIVLSHGRIAERGTHETLIKQQGLYYETYKAQYGAFMEVS